MTGDSRTAATTMETVTSADGTQIAYERTGSGPPLVLVHGCCADHTMWEPFDVRSALAEHHTVYTVDRRGRGESGDAATYEVEREFEDVAAVVESIDEPTVLLGHSYGALCALDAALRADDLGGLVLYEAPVPWAIARSYLSNEEAVADIEALLADGENEQAVAVFLRDIVGLSSAMVDTYRSTPKWPVFVDTVPTVPREYRAFPEYTFDTARFDRMTTPTLLLVGSESHASAKEATDELDDVLPNSQVVTLEGHGHVAMTTAPELFVDEVLAFTRELPHR